MRTPKTETSLRAFIRDVVLLQFAAQLNRLVEKEEYFAVQRDTQLAQLKFTVVFDGAPYTEHQLETETLGQFLQDCEAFGGCSSGSAVLNLVLHFLAPYTEQPVSATRTRTAPSPKEALTKVHEVVWKDTKDCRGSTMRVKMLTIPDKHKAASALRNKLRRLTGLNIFYRDNLEFRPAALLKHINVLKESVFGVAPEPEPEQSPSNRPTPAAAPTPLFVN